MDLKGAHVLVTGGASGLGRATALHLAAAGAAVTILDRDTAGAEAVAQACSGLAFGLDVADADAAETAIARAEAAAGPIRGLVNCAGVGTAARIAGRDGPMPLETFERVIRVNLIGTFNMLRLAAARMAEAPPLEGGERGAVVNTASVAAFDGQVGQAAYAASKGGIVSLALPAARELARFGIRVNTVAPGVFLTPLLEELPTEVREGIAAAIPFPPRLGAPDEFAAAVRFCLESAYLNAEVIRLDGALRLPPR
jgi:NAD(P)-dependent dehydrogenase (short-subunit alcohol dehydrogenase family)